MLYGKPEYYDFSISDPIQYAEEYEVAHEVNKMSETLQEPQYHSQEDLLPVLLVLLALKYRIELDFTEHGVSCRKEVAKCSEPVFQNLLNLTNQIFKEKYDFQWLEEYYKTLFLLSPAGIHTYIVCTLETIMQNVLPDLANREYNEPHICISDYINFVLNQYECRTVLNPLAGTGSIAFLSAYYANSYMLHQSSSISASIVEAIFYILGINCETFLRKDQVSVPDYDGLVCVLPQDYSPKSLYEDVTYRAFQKAVKGRRIHDVIFKEILNGNRPFMCAMLMVNKEFCYSDHFYETRKQLVENNWVYEVTAVPDYLNDNGQAAGMILLLDFVRGDDDIIFYDSSMLQELIRRYENDSSGVSFDDENEDIFKTLIDALENFDKGYHFDYTVSDVYFNHNSYYVKKDELSRNAYMLLPDLYFNFHNCDEGESSAFFSDFLRVHSEGTKSLNSIVFTRRNSEDTITFDYIDNQSVDFDYLLFEIESERFQNYLSLLNNIPESEYISEETQILNYRIIFPSLAVQRERLVEFKKKKDRIYKAKNIYNVLVAGEVETKNFSKWNINILAHLDSSENFNSVISDAKIGRLLDAVIINVNLDMSNGRYKGLRKILKEKKYLIFIIGDVDMDNLEADLDPEDFNYCKNGKLFPDQEMEKLILALRKQLDYKNSPECKVREHYKDVFAAAGRVDDYLKSDNPISDFLIHQIIDNYRNVNTFVDSYDNIRAICERFIKEIQTVNVLPPLKNLGAVTKLLSDNFYNDKQMGIYYLRKKIFPQSLVESLSYLTKICNKAIHTQEKSPQLGMAVTNILMSFILWFDERISEGFFEQPHQMDEYWLTQGDVNTRFLASNMNCVKEVECLEKEDGNFYYYCDQTHLESSPNVSLKKGMKIFIRKVSLEQLPYVDDDHFIPFYAKKGNYDIL